MKKLFLLSILALLTSFLNAQTHWTPVDPAGSSGMTATIVGVVQFEGEEQHNNNLEVGVFHGDECRGTCMASTVISDRYYVFMSVFGLEGEEDTFKIYDHETGAELDMSGEQTYTYQDNDNIGTIPSPFAFNFLYNHFVINVSASPSTSGTVSGGGTYDRGQTVDLVATPNTGNTFVKWTKNSVQVSTSATYSFPATYTSQGDYVAVFETASYEITVSANPTEGGTVSGGGTYNHGASATLTATANTGYTFTNWTKGGVVVSTSPTYELTVTAAGDYVANFTLNTYAINVTANPTEGGTVSGGGTYNHGASATLTATANTGYTFTNWTKGGAVVSTNPTFTFNVTAAGDYVANFTLNSYAITVAANPTEGGTVSGGGTYNHGASATLTATANTGYTFTNWTKGGAVVSTNPTYTFNVTAAGDYVANFTLNSYAITVAANPTEGGTVSGGGTYNHGASATLTATANTGYTFTNWTKGGAVVSTNPTYTFNVTAAGDYVANFTLNSYAITVAANPTEGGTVSGGGTYNHGASATLTATANTGYTFTNWTKGGAVVSTNPTYTFNVTVAGDYVANFTLNSYAITATADPTSGGTITGAGTYNHGASCTLEATPNTGCTFVNWTKDGVQVSTDATYTFTVTGAGAYVAHFTMIGYEISVTANPAEGGTVTGAGAYTYGQSCTLTATPATGYTFTNWTKGAAVVSTDATYTFDVTAAGDYVANFTLNSYAITVSASPTEGGTVSGGGTYNHGASATLTATAATGYTFTNWTKNGTQVSTEATYTFTVTEAGAYVANFTQNSYTITVAANPTEGGTVSGGGTFTHGASATLTATPATGYTFTNWTKGGTEVSTEANYTFTVTAAGDYVANFTRNSYLITATANPISGGTITGAGTYYHGETCTLIATANTGCSFVKWTKDGVDVSTDNTINFTVEAAASYVAHFTLIGYEVSATAEPAEGGTITGMGGYNYGTTATLNAIPNSGYVFVNWTKDNVEVSTDAEYSFTVTEATTLVAHFSLNSFTLTINYLYADGTTAAPTHTETVNCNSTYSVTSPTITGYTPDIAIVEGTMGTENVTVNVTYTVNSHLLTITYVTPSGVAAPPQYSQSFDYGTSYSVASPTLEGYTPDVATVAGYMPDNDVNVTVTYTVNSHVLTITYVTPSGVAAPPQYSQSFDFGTPYAVASPTLEGYTPDIATVAGNMPDNDVNVTVTYTVNSHTLTITYVTPSGVAAPPQYSQSYDYGAPYAVASPTLEGYTPDIATVAGNMPDNDVNVTVTYTVNSHLLTITYVTPSGVTAPPQYSQSYDYGTSYSVASPTLEGYTPDIATVAGNMPDNDVNVTVTYSINSYTLTVNYLYVDGTTAAPTHTESVNYNASYSVASPAITGYTPDQAVVSGTMGTENVTVNVTYTVNSYVITATANPAAYGTVAGAGTYNYGQTATLTATPAANYVFINWTKDGVQVSTATTYTFTVTGDGDYVANFSPGYVDIVAYASQADFGTVEGGGSYLVGTTCTLTATPYEGFLFVKWAKGNQVVSTDAVYSFEVTDGGTYRALFEREPYYITAEVNPADAGTVTGTGGTFYNNTTCQLIATANEGYRFVNWTKDGAVVSSNYIYEFAVTGSAHFVANFESTVPVIETVEITAEADPAEGGTVTGAGTYEVGETVTLTATANTDYRFVNWTVNGQVVSESAAIAFVAEQDLHFVAHFISTVGVDDLDEITISVYPNPAVEKLFVESQAPIRRCEVYSITGQRVMQFEDCGEMFEIQVHHLTAGSYLIRMTSDNFVEIREFVKK